MGILGFVWQKLVIAGTHAEAALGFGLSDLPDPTSSVEPYGHSIDGQQQAGVYLGLRNVTTWGYNYINDTEAGEFYYLRLLGPDSNNMATGEQLNEGEFTGYVKIME